MVHIQTAKAFATSHIPSNTKTAETERETSKRGKLTISSLVSTVSNEINKRHNKHRHSLFVHSYTHYCKVLSKAVSLISSKAIIKRIAKQDM